MKIASHSRHPRGSALLAVYWTIGILSIAVFTTAQLVLFEVTTSSIEEDAFRAELMADSAIAIAAHPGISAGDPLLYQEISATDSFYATIQSEGGRLNLNYLLTPEYRSVLERLFESWGVDQMTASSVVDSLIDWTDPDEFATNKGWERFQYRSAGLEFEPSNQPFQNLDEATFVSGFRAIVSANPDWKSAFTLYSSGKLDLSAATPELIAAVCNCTPETAVAFVEDRNGRDGEPFTADDVRFETLSQAFDLLRRGGADREALSSLVSVSDNILRIVGVGTSGDVTMGRSVVIRRTPNGKRPLILDIHTRRLTDSP